MAKAKWSKRTWTEAALRAIAHGGVDAVAIENLATELGATRGSFYWHFRDRQALLEEAMLVWEELETDRIEQVMTAIADPAERMRTSFRIALADTDEPIPNLEPAVYAQLGDPVVAAAIRRVSLRRIEILTRGFTDMGLAPETARLQAVLTYATYLGWLQLRRITADVVPEAAAEGPAAAALVAHIIDELIEDNRETRDDG